MKTITLSRGQFALVDDEDFETVNQFRWYAFKNYARRRKGKDKVFMHREILGLVGSGVKCDHIDRNGLNNQRANLRIASNSENGANRKSGKGSSSRFIGVHLDRKCNIWRASITKNKVVITLGAYFVEEDAARAYNIAAKEIHGDFASLNDVDMTIAPIRNKRGWHKIKHNK